MTPTERRIVAAFLLLAGPVAWRLTEWHTWTTEWTFRAKTDDAMARIAATEVGQARQLRDWAAAQTREAFSMPAPFIGKHARGASTRIHHRSAPDGLVVSKR